MADPFDFGVNYYQQKLGLTPEQARGALRWMQNVESGLRPNAFNPAGGGQGAYGIGQWRGPRQASLLSQYGPNPNYEQQLAFSVSEFQGPEARALQALKSAKTESDAYKTFGAAYERPGTGLRKPEGYFQGPGESGPSMHLTLSPGTEQFDLGRTLDTLLMSAPQQEQKQEDPLALLDTMLATPPQHTGGTGAEAAALPPPDMPVQSPQIAPMDLSAFDLPPAAPIQPLPNPLDPHGTTRNRYVGGGRGMEAELVSPREDLEREIELARAHFNVMKSLSPTDRLDYFRNMALSQGASRADLDMEHEAAAFMNLVNYKPSPDPIAASHGLTDRDPGMGNSDALLFFGPGLKQDRSPPPGPLMPSRPPGPPLGLLEPGTKTRAKVSRPGGMDLLDQLLHSVGNVGAFWAGASQGLGLPGNELRERLPQMAPAQQAGAALGRIPGGMLVEPIREGGETLRAAMQGQPVGAEEMVQAAMPALTGSIGVGGMGAGPRLPRALAKGARDAAKVIEKFFSPTTVDPQAGIAETLIRHEVGRARRLTEKAEAQVSARGPLANPAATSMAEAAKEPWRPLVARHVPEFERYVAAKQAGQNPPKPALLRFLDFVETRTTGAPYQGPPELRPLADTLRKLFAERAAAISSEPSTGWAGFIEDYFPHQWKDQGAAGRDFGSTGRQGSGRSLRQRDIPTTSEGIDRGHVPASFDPVELGMRYIHNMDIYLAHNRIFRIAREHGLVKFYQRGQQPEGWAPVTGRMAEKAVATGGVPEALGLQAYAPEGFARVYNNAISSGFLADQLGGPFYTALLHAKNTVTQSVLALSGYHLKAMGQEASASAFASGIQSLKQGDIIAGLKQLGLGALVPLGPFPGGKAIKDVFGTGRKLERQYRGVQDYGPDYEKVAKLFAGAGGRMVGRGAEYRMSASDNYFKSWRRGAMMADWKIGLSRIAEGNPLFAPAKAIGFLGRELGRINETITAPLFDKAIPRLKAAAFYDEMSGWLGANPTASYAEQLSQARRVADTIDDRFGEMVMDNIFWGQRAKQGLQLAATSLGWELGSLRSIGGSAFDALRKQFSPRVRYVIGLGAAIALQNAVSQYLKTGKTPGEDIGGTLSPGGALDLTVPRTGGTTPEGAYERVLQPGFEKDILGYAHDFAGELAGKLSPFGRLGVEAWTGTNYFGQQIAPFPKYTPEWFKAYANHVLGSMVPIPFQQEKYKGSNIGFPERLMGDRPAAERWQNPQRADVAETNRRIGALRSTLKGLYAHGARTTEDRENIAVKAKEIMRQIDGLQRDLAQRTREREPSRNLYRPPPKRGLYEESVPPPQSQPQSKWEIPASPYKLRHSTGQE